MRIYLAAAITDFVTMIVGDGVKDLVKGMVKYVYSTFDTGAAKKVIIHTEAVVAATKEKQKGPDLRTVINLSFDS
jgi:hypothetical protein